MVNKKIYFLPILNVIVIIFAILIIFCLIKNNRSWELFGCADNILTDSKIDITKYIGNCTKEKNENYIVFIAFNDTNNKKNYLLQNTGGTLNFVEKEKIEKDDLDIEKFQFLINHTGKATKKNEFQIKDKDSKIIPDFTNIVLIQTCEEKICSNKNKVLFYIQKKSVGGGSCEYLVKNDDHSIKWESSTYTASTEKNLSKKRFYFICYHCKPIDNIKNPKKLFGSTLLTVLSGIDCAKFPPLIYN